MGTVKHTFAPRDGLTLASAFPALIKINGTNGPTEYLAFDATTLEKAYFEFIAQSYGSGSLTVNVFWEADSATSGGVRWNARLAAITPETDTQDATTKAFATAQGVSDTHLGTTARRLHKATITISSNLDSITADDICWLWIERDPADAADTMVGDAWIKFVELTYSDT